MAEKIHVIIQQKDMYKLRLLAYKHNLSLSAVVDVIGLYYSKYALDSKINRDVLLDPHETVLKIKTEKNPYRPQIKSVMEYYTSAIYYYFNQNVFTKEQRLELKELNKKISVELQERIDPNALYNQVMRMNYRAEKEKHKCKK